MSALDFLEGLLRPSTFSLVAPLMPGGVFVLGFAVHFKAALPQINGIPVLALAVFASYTAGFVIYGLTEIGLSLFGFSLGRLLASFTSFTKEGLEPWNNKQWREIAKRYIGDELAPDAYASHCALDF